MERSLVFNGGGGYALNMLKLVNLFCVLLLLSGCAAYEPAVVEDDVISNPKVGWNGYSIRIPDGMAILETPLDERASNQASNFKAWYTEASNRYAADYYTSFDEQFLMESPEQTFLLSFISKTYELPVGWKAMTSVKTQYVIQKMINRKMVIINDMKAHSEQVEINGQRGWYISGLIKPYFKWNPEPQAYEGIFLLGNLKDTFWIEAFGAPLVRNEMKNRVFRMAETLKIN